MNRREFISLLGSAAAWPVAARAQQPETGRRIGVLTQYTEGDPAALPNFAAFQRGLHDLGWIEGRNVTIEYRWGAADSNRYRRFAAELVSLQPDVLIASTGPSLDAMLQATRTIPIVFTSVIDPVDGGLVESLARPGGNATGFTSIEWGLSGKWLELLKQILPRLTHAAVIRDPANPSGAGQFGAIQAVAPSLGVELRPINSRDAEGIERAVTAFALVPNSGLIVTAAATTGLHRQTIITAAAQHRLPAVYPYRYFADDGGLISYGPDQLDLWRLAAGYVDRILKGAKPSDLPVQAPTKYELVVNLKTAKALGVEMPSILLTRADEVIE